MHNLKTVFIFEVVRALKKPSFWLSALFTPIFIGAVFAINAYSSSNAGQVTEKNKQEKFSFMLKDDSGYVKSEVVAALKGQEISDKQAGINAVKDGKVDAFFFYPKDPGKQEIETYAKDLGLVKNGRYDSTAKIVLQHSISADLASPEQAAILTNPPAAKNVTYKDGKETPGFLRMVAPGIFLLLLIMSVFSLLGQMLTSTTEEKENRVTEIILTTIKAKTLIIGKILAIITLGILQMLIVTIPSVIIYLILNGKINFDLSSIPLDPAAITIGAVLFVSSFILLTGVAVAIGAAMPNAKDANNFISPVYVLLFAPGWAGATIVTDPSQPLVQILTYFPLTAPTTLLLRNTVGNLTTAEAIIGITLVTIVGLLAIALAIRFFRFGTIEYSRRLGFKDILPVKR